MINQLFFIHRIVTFFNFVFQIFSLNTDFGNSFVSFTNTLYDIDHSAFKCQYYSTEHYDIDNQSGMELEADRLSINVKLEQSGSGMESEWNWSAVGIEAEWNRSGSGMVSI